MAKTRHPKKKGIFPNGYIRHQKRVPADSLFVVGLHRGESIAQHVSLAWATPGLSKALIRNALLALAHDLLPIGQRRQPGESIGPEPSTSVVEREPGSGAETASANPSIA